MNFYPAAKDMSELTAALVQEVLALAVSPATKKILLTRIFNSLGEQFFQKMFDDISELFASKAIGTTGFQNADDQTERLATKLIRQQAFSRRIDHIIGGFFNSLLSGAEQEAFSNAKSLGKVPTLRRTMRSETCAWCTARVGTWTNPSGDLFARHDNCDCRIEVSGYNSRNGELKNYTKSDKRRQETNRNKSSKTTDSGGFKTNFAEDYPEDIKNAHINKIKELDKKFPQVKEGFNKYGVALSSNPELTGSILARFGRNNAGEPLGIEFGVQYENLDKLKEGMKKRIKEGHFMPASDLQGYIAAHEFGHALENTIINNLRKSYSDIKKTETKEFFDARATEIELEITDIAYEKKSDLEIFKELSKFGLRDGKEFFAEVFANAFCGKPNILGESMLQYLKEIGLL